MAKKFEFYKHLKKAEQEIADIKARQNKKPAPPETLAKKFKALLLKFLIPPLSKQNRNY